MRLVLFSVLVLLTGVAQAEPSKYFTANLTEDLQPAGATEKPKTRLFIYTRWPLHQVEYKASVTMPWQPMVVRQKQGKLFVYGSDREVLPATGQEIRVRGRFSNSVRFTDSILVESESETGYQICTLDTGKLEQLPLTRSEIYYGSPYLTPQTIAQARVNHLVSTGQSGHLGSGVINTNVGTLCEGWGCNSGSNSLPMTCVGAGRPFADAIARTRGGLLHRVRFYRGGTWHP
jgi:hypothetical protein